MSAFPEAVRAFEWRREFVDGEASVLEKRLRRRLTEGGYLIHGIEDADGLCGLALTTAEVGRTEPFIFLVAFDRELRVRGIEVLEYRESRGGEIRRDWFLEQYRGIGINDPMRLNREIENVPGATLSAVAVGRGVKKALAAMESWFGRQDASYIRAAFARNGVEIELPDHVGDLRRFQFLSMGTVASLVVREQDPERAARLRDEVREVMAQVEKRLSLWDQDSEMSKAQVMARSGATKLSPALYRDLSRAVHAARASSGAFDPTVLPFLVTQERTSFDRTLVGVGNVELCPRGGTMKFRTAGVGLTTDAFAKGIAVDEAVSTLRRLGVKSARVGFRSTSFMLGGPHAVPIGDGRWIEVRDAAVSASGSDQNPTHILDPRTLQPAQFGGTVVVVAPSGFEADWLSTAAVVLGPELAPARLAAAGRSFFFRGN